MQTFFLGCALGPDEVSGYGEADAKFRLLPPPCLSEIPDKSVGIVVNVDSFPEIERAVALDYLQEIKRVGHVLLSINQEARAPNRVFNASQTIVHELIHEVGGFERVYRFPYWMMPRKSGDSSSALTASLMASWPAGVGCSPSPRISGSSPGRMIPDIGRYSMRPGSAKPANTAS